MQPLSYIILLHACPIFLLLWPCGKNDIDDEWKKNISSEKKPTSSEKKQMNNHIKHPIVSYC